MSVELISVLIAVLAIGVAQSGLILTSNRGLREDMARMEARLREDMKQLAERVARVEHSQAKPSQARRAAGRVARGHHRTGQGLDRDYLGNVAERNEPVSFTRHC